MEVIQMNEKMYEIMRDGRGFIAALDQSGGSSAKTLKNYGIDESEYSSEEEMFNLIHEMRKRVMTSKVFTNEHILGTILFEKTMMSEVNGKFTADYLWDEKGIVSFLKVDKGLAEEKNGVKLMKEIPNLKEEIEEANKKHVFGTKMRSVIYEANEEGIRDIVNQQFEFAKTICDPASDIRPPADGGKGTGDDEDTSIYRTYRVQPPAQTFHPVATAEPVRSDLWRTDRQTEFPQAGSRNGLH